MTNSIKILLAILLFICLARMPYGYYQLVRFLAMVGFSILAYQAYQKTSQNEMIVYLILALLFQPIFKIALGRQLWNMVDVIIGIGLILSIWIKSSSNDRKKL